MLQQRGRAFEYTELSSCALCGRPFAGTDRRIDKTFPWGFARFVRCETCGSWSQSPQISARSLSQWFDSEDYQGSSARRGAAYVNYLDDEASRRAEALGRFRRDLAMHVAPGARVLELGCATGSLLSVIRDHGCEVVGVDLSAKFASAARTLYGIEVLQGDLADFSFPPQSFDLIALFGTMGNLRDVQAYLRRFRGLLKPAGRLIFNFIDADSPVVRWVYRSKFWMFTPSVACFMTQRGCEELLQQTGFRVVSLRRDRQRPSFSKLLHHARLDAALPLLKAAGMAGAALPIALPIPSARFVEAMPATV